VLTIIQQLCSMKQKHTKYTQINTHKRTHSEMGPAAMGLVKAGPFLTDCEPGSISIFNIYLNNNNVELAYRPSGVTSHPVR